MGVLETNECDCGCDCRAGPCRKLLAVSTVNIVRTGTALEEEEDERLFRVITADVLASVLLLEGLALQQLPPVDTNNVDMLLQLV